ncbi:MAG: TfoX/Sxy family protein [Oscillospiraceae bacterium]|nr:TfoX/Sxy family protein [Oscillospiraceae bacterium]
MASSKEYLAFILDQLSDLDGVTYRAMMGEYILYYRGKIVGGLYDDRFLVKATPTALRLMPEAPRELPYEGAKEMLLVDSVDDRAFLNELLPLLWEELPAPAKRKPRDETSPAKP